MTYTMLVKYLSTRCQILVNSCQPAVKFLSNFYGYKKHLSKICQLDFLVYSPVYTNLKVYHTKPLAKVCLNNQATK